MCLRSVFRVFNDRCRGIMINLHLEFNRRTELP